MDLKFHINIYKFLPMAATCMVAAILTGCAGGGDEPSPTPPVISPDAQAAISFRAPEAHQSRAALQDLHTTFCVWTRKTMPDLTMQTVMNGYEVRYTNPKWIYDGIAANQTERFWDFSASSYRFVGVAPAQGKAHATLDADDHITLTGLTGNAQATDTDWLIARHLRQNGTPVVDTDLLNPTSPLPTQPTVIKDDVSPRFHHVMSQIEFRVYTLGGPLTLSNLTITTNAHLAVSGDYQETLADTWRTSYLNWKNYGYDTSLSTLLEFAPADPIDYLQVTGTNRDTAHSMGPRLEVPQPFIEGGMTVTVNAVADGHEISASFVLTDGWNTDTRYIYYLGLDVSNIILFDISALEWEEGDTPIEQNQSNW